MPILLLIIGIGLFLAVNRSSRQHYEDWRAEQPPEVGHAIYPGHFDLGELLGTLVLAIILLVLIATVSGG
jgi:hypothetical protein